jgi:hypothetical protein
MSEAKSHVDDRSCDKQNKEMGNPFRRNNTELQECLHCVVRHLAYRHRTALALKREQTRQVCKENSCDQPSQFWTTVRSDGALLHGVPVTAQRSGACHWPRLVRNFGRLPTRAHVRMGLRVRGGRG